MLGWCTTAPLFILPLWGGLKGLVWQPPGTLHSREPETPLCKQVTHNTGVPHRGTYWVAYLWWHAAQVCHPGRPLEGPTLTLASLACTC